MYPHTICPRAELVLELGKEGLTNRAGWKCTLQNVRNFRDLRLAKPVEFSAEPDTRISILSFPLGVNK